MRLKNTFLSFMVCTASMAVSHKVFARSVLLEWNFQDGVDNYHVEVSKLPDFKNIIIKAKTPSNKHKFDFLAPGKYFWRVRSEKKDILSSWGETGNISVIKAIKKTSPTVLYPFQGQVLKVNQNITEVLFRWKDVPKTGVSKLKISSDKDKKIKFYKTNKSQLKLKLKAAEDYAWSVGHSELLLSTDKHDFSIKQFTQHLSFSLGLVGREISAKNNSTSSRGTLGTRQGQMLRINWLKQKKKISFGGVYGLDRLSFENPENRKLKKNDFLLSSFGLIGEYHLFPAISIYDHLIYGQELYYFGVDEAFVRLNQGNAFSNRLGLQWVHHLRQNFNIGVRAGLNSLFPTNSNDYTSQTGHGFHSQLSVMKLSSNQTYSGSIEYLTQNQNTPTFDQDHTSLRLFVGIIYPL